MKDKENIREIDIVALVKKVLKEWKTLLAFCGVGCVIGLIVAFNTPKLFKSEVILAPEFSSGGAGMSGSLSEIASSFGVDLGNSSSVDAIYPELYPEIFVSTDFLISLYDVPVRLQEDNTPRTYIEHLRNDCKTPFWNYPKRWITRLIQPKELITGGTNGAVDSYYVSRKNWEIIKSLREMLVCSVDKKTSVISISAVDQDPMVASIMADTLKNRLQEYITRYRTSKCRIDLEHYQQLADMACKDYLDAKEKYGKFCDMHTNVILMSVNVERDDLENDLQLKYNMYTQSLGQLKIAEAKLQEHTPAFTVIQRSVTNPKPVSTPKIVILFIWVFIFALFDAAWVLFLREFMNNRKKAAKN